MTFRISGRMTEYGDKRRFFDYRILMIDDNRVVGAETGDRRSALSRADALKLARKRIAELRKRRLVPICVTRKHIEDGEARNCNSCAISQALWHSQEAMGFPKDEWNFEVSPYGCFVDPRGIVLAEKYGTVTRHIPAAKMPDIVTSYKRKGKPLVYFESMVEWTMQWDDWAESRYMSLHEWREKHGYDEGERPYKPTPCSFVLDLDAMVTEE
jgi:hypothetical protein